MADKSTKNLSATWGAILALALLFCPLAMAGQSVTLEWNPSATPGVIGYMVYCGTDGTNFDSQMDAGSNTSATVADLQPGTTNYFEVVAYNVNHIESPPSNLIEYTVPNPTPTVTVSANPANAGNVTGGGTFAAGTALTATATANSGYTFNNWSENGIVQSTSANYSFNLGTDLNLVANFTANLVTYTVTASVGNNGTISPNGPQTVLTGANITFIAAPASNYQISQWLVNGMVVQSGGSAYTVQDVTTNDIVSVSFSANSTTTSNNLLALTVLANSTNAGSVTGGGTFAAGTAVTVTATANSGYTFTNWTENGIVQGDSTNYSFSLTTNCNLVANFTTNEVTYVVTPSAGDNGTISPNGPQAVVTGSNITFTAAPASNYQVNQWLVNGTVVQSGGSAYTLQDVTTNNVVDVTFSANPITTSNNLLALTVLANSTNAGSVTGGGTFAAGTAVTVTATANSGYTFTNWTENGTVQSDSTNYSFSLTTNCNLVANFTTNPVTYMVTSSAGNNGTISPNGPQVVVTGSNITFTAAPASNYQVNQWLVNGTVVQSGGSAYTLQDVTTNNAVDVTFSANPATVSNSVPPVTVQTIANTNFSLLVSGDGTLSPNLTAKSFQEGKKFTLTAIAARGSVFSNWVSNGIVAATTPRYTFLVESNVVLQANFIPNPFLPAVGLYHGLFYDSTNAAEESSGAFVADVTSDGFYTANIRLGTLSYSYSGVFSLTGVAFKTIPRAGLSPITVQLQLGVSNSPMTGTISDGNWTAVLEADHATYSSAHPAPQAGKYTLLIPGSDDASNQPGGNGFGTVTVYASGFVSFSGSLGDGTPVTSSSTVSSLGQWPFYVSLYAGKGSILGWLSFTNNGDIAGQINWFKLPQKAAKLYPGGFTNNTEAIGSVYKYTNGFPILSFSDGLLSLVNGDLAYGFTDQVGLGPEIQVTGQSASKLIYNTALGLFRGNVLNPETGKLISVNGAVLQNQNLGAGYFLGTNESGSVVISPAQ